MSLCMFMNKCAKKNVTQFMNQWILQIAGSSSILMISNVRLPIFIKQNYGTCVLHCDSNSIFSHKKYISLNSHLHNSSLPGLKFAKTVCHRVYNTECDKVTCVKNVQDAFNCSFEEAKIIVNDNKHLLYILNETSVNKVKSFQELGFSEKAIKENVWILSYNTNELKGHIHLINKWKFRDINVAVSMFKLSFTKLYKYTVKMLNDSRNLTDYGNRLKYFARKLQCSDEEACNKFMKYQFMFRMNLDHLKLVMNILLEGGIKPESLLGDVWIFRYSPEFLVERMNKVKEMENTGILDSLKPWMLRCRSDILERTCDLREENQAALSPHTSIANFLCEQLQLSPEKLEIMMAKHPPVRAVQVSKLKEIIDFLYLEGFDSNHIYSTPRVLCHSLTTIKERLKLLQDHGFEVKSLMTLCKNRKNFQELMKKLQEREYTRKESY